MSNLKKIIAKILKMHNIKRYIKKSNYILNFLIRNKLQVYLFMEGCSYFSASIRYAGNQMLIGSWGFNSLIIKT